MEGLINVRSTHRQQMHNQAQPLFNMEFHNFMERESHQAHFELAMEFGLSLQEVKTLKQKLARN